MPKLIVCGATGRVGSLICDLAGEDCFWETVLKSTRRDPLENRIVSGDVVIDFTLPEGTATHVGLAVEHKKPIVIGTTGFSETQLDQIREASRKIPIVLAPNMSIGVNVLFHLIETATHALGNRFAITIEETHHLHKKDKPSGTAKEMAAAAQRSGGQVGRIDSRREGEVVGDHTIQFAAPTESLRLSHHAIDRKIFAEGALTAARWVLAKKPGLYTMKNVLGLE